MLALNTLPADIDRLAGRLSGRITDAVRDQPYLRAILPEPRTIDQLGDTNRDLLIEKLSDGLMDLTIGRRYFQAWSQKSLDALRQATHGPVPS